MNMFEPDSKNAALYTDELEKKRHDGAIQKLTQELDVPAEEIRQLYEEVLGVLKEGATITDFLPILVSRSVKKILIQQYTRELKIY
jgi:hypothetical protein